MASILSWHTTAWEDYEHISKYDKQMLKKINELIKSALRTPYEGLGKPEPLKENLRGCWSRRINEADRLVYKVSEDEETITIIQCKGHYSS